MYSSPFLEKFVWFAIEIRVNKHTLTLSSTKTHCFQFCFFALLFFVVVVSLSIFMCRCEYATGAQRERSHHHKCMCDERNSRYVSIEHRSVSHISRSLSLYLPFVYSVVCSQRSLCVSLPSPTASLICSWNRFFVSSAEMSEVRTYYCRWRFCRSSVQYLSSASNVKTVR